MQRPWRLLTGPIKLVTSDFASCSISVVRCALSVFDRFDTLQKFNFFRQRRAILLYHQGAFLLDENEVEPADRVFDECIRISTNPHHFFVAGACKLAGLGRIEEAIELFHQANLLRNPLKSQNNQRSLSHMWAGNFGHIALIDYVVKMTILENGASDDITLFIDEGNKVANEFFVHQWSNTINFKTSKKPIFGRFKTNDPNHYDLVGPRLPDGTTGHLWNVAANVYRDWYAQSRGPILTFPADLRQKGRELLESVGIPEDAWFVAVHVRERTSKAYHVGLHDALNARIDSYLPAIKEITARGGWVVRIGDTNMSNLPNIQNVIDYCHTPSIRADWMDIFLCAECLFLLGTSSGPAYVPQLYGKPAVLSNWWPPAQRPWHARDIFIPKIHWNTKENRALTLEETLQEPFGYCNSLQYLRQEYAVEIQDNDPEDITDAVIEMFDALEGASSASAKDEARRLRANRVYDDNKALGLGEIAHGFARRHAHLIDDPNPER